MSHLRQDGEDEDEVIEAHCRDRVKRRCSQLTLQEPGGRLL